MVFNIEVIEFRNSPAKPGSYFLLGVVHNAQSSPISQILLVMQHGIGHNRKKERWKIEMEIFLIQTT
jgi:hypothetical protein